MPVIKPDTSNAQLCSIVHHGVHVWLVVLSYLLHQENKLKRVIDKLTSLIKNKAKIGLQSVQDKVENCTLVTGHMSTTD